jgi:hypothetical protein
MHGLSRDGEIKSRLYKTWQGYQQHGLNGPTWDCNFAAFYDWAIGTNYEEGMTLARINKGQECSPANCFWLDAKSATLNQRRSA